MLVMRPLKMFAVLVAIILSTAFCAAAELANPGFEDGLASWRVFSHAETPVTISVDSPASGRNCALMSAASGAASLISAPIADAPNPFTITFRARCIDSKGTLSVGIAHETAIEPLWKSSAFADDRWHKVQLSIAATAPSLAFVATGGQWAIDDIACEAYSADSPVPHDKFAENAVYPEPLPEGWQPDGLLDARRRAIGDNAELLIKVQGLEVSIPEHISLRRGIRQGIETYCSNRGTVEQELKVSIQGPAGVIVPDWTVPIPPKRTMHIWIPIQRLITGDCWGRITFSSGAESKSAAIEITSAAAYPVFGISAADETLPTAADMASLAQLGGDAARLALPPEDPQSAISLIQAFSSTFIVAVPPGTAETAASANSASTFWMPSYQSNATFDQATDALCELAQALYARQRTPMICSSPFHLLANPQTGALSFSPEIPVSAATLSGCPNIPIASSLQSLVLDMPDLPASALISAQVDGKLASTPAECWTRLNRMTDLQPVRAAATEAGVHLPFTIDGIDLPTCGDRRLDALKLARALLNSTYQGATAAFLPSDTPNSVGLSLTADDADPISAMFRAISSELAGAMPVVALPAQEGIAAATDSDVTYRPFLRGDEGIVAMWNNTCKPAEIAITFRSQPLHASLLRMSADGDFIADQMQSIFRLGDRAKDAKLDAVFLRLDPLDVTILTVRLGDPQVSWLRAIERGEKYFITEKDDRR